MLLDRAVRAVNEGDRVTATTLAGQVLAVDRGNPEAEDLLTAPARYGAIRRLTIMFVDLVDSTALSTQLEPEPYHTLVGRYRDEVRRAVERYEGHISSIKGDGLLVVFGHPRAHEHNVRLAVAAGLDITRTVARLSERAERQFGVSINVRVGIHRGLVYLDVDQDDVYGFAANLAARLAVWPNRARWRSRMRSRRWCATCRTSRHFRPSRSRASTRRSALIWCSANDQRRRRRGHLR